MKKTNIIIKVLLILCMIVTINVVIPNIGYCENGSGGTLGDVPEQVADDIKKGEEEQKNIRTQTATQESRSTSKKLKEQGKTYTGKSSDTIDGYMNDGKDFISGGEKNSSINQGQLQKTSNILYNIFLGAGIIIAILVGMFLGIKYMMGSIEEKAELKETLIAYVVGCIVIFGAFGIWKLVAELFSGV